MSGTTPPPTTVPAPIAGGYEDNSYWSGGPRITNKFIKPVSPFTFRPDGFEKGQKIFKYAVTPLAIKYQGNEKDRLMLSNFGKRVWKHLIMSGMDSAFYFVDSVDQEEKNIIEFHARFSVD
ncbi:MAG: hypothetical protein ACRDL7_10915, partial [Gaiellaceae bacterium]